MNEERQKRFITPGMAWRIVKGPGEGKRLDQYAEEKRKEKAQQEDSKKESQKPKKDS